MSYFISIDQGTTGTTAVLVDATSLKFIDKLNQEFEQIYPEPGLVEHNLNEIWKTVEFTVSNLLKKNNVSAKNIVGIGITNQRETTCAFNKNGDPLYNAIVWQDRRTHKTCEKLKAQNKEVLIKEKTGLTLDPYFSGTKIQWLLNNNSKVSESLNKDDLRFGTIDTFLLYKLTNGSSYKTDATNASRTLLMNLKTRKWDSELCDIFEVDPKNLPEICDSFGEFGTTKGLTFLPDGIPITCILGDQQAALFGQAGINEGDIKCTYGTGSFILLNSGEKIVHSSNGLLTTVAYQFQNKTIYALEGSCYIAGAAVQWLRDNLNMFEKSSDIENLALNIKSLNKIKNILFLPFFTGIGSPYWKSDAKGAILGLTRDTKEEHIARACLEGIAFSINDLINAMKIDTKISLNSLKVDGGAVANNLLMEIQASVSELEIVRPSIIETTAYGVALGSAIGLQKLSFNDLNQFWKSDRVFIKDSNSNEYYEEKRQYWKKTIERLYL